MSNFLIEGSVYQSTSDPAQLVIVDAPVFEARGIFSITASNQLQGTLWAVKDGEIYTFQLISASYQILNAAGTPIGITESGLTPDANGFFYITPVLAANIVDLTHYTILITINGAAKTIESAIGIALGE